MDELSNKVAQAKRLLVSIERMTGASEQFLLPTTRLVSSVHDTISLLIDELECLYAGTGVRVENLVPDTFSGLDIADESQIWTLTAALSREGPEEGLQRGSDQCLDLGFGSTLSVEATLASADEKPKVEVVVRSETAVLGKCWFAVADRRWKSRLLKPGGV